MERLVPRPQADEHAPYYSRYIELVADSDVPARLHRQREALRVACEPLSEAGALHRYAPGKWSVKEVVGHLTDSDRVFAYRALRILRSDPTPMPGFDEDAFVAAAHFDREPMGELLDEFDAARANTLAVLRSAGPEAWERRGVASGAEVSLRALVYIIAGHTEHHLRLLAERYGIRAPGADAPLPR